MAEAIFKFLHGTQFMLTPLECGQDIDGYAVTVMDEIGDLSRHNAKTFDDLEDDYYDLVITLSPKRSIGQ